MNLHRALATAAAVGVAATSLATLALLSGGPAAAVPAASLRSGGTWGGYGYLNGTVCSTGSGATKSTSPLASWDLGGGKSPAFLTSPVSSTAGIDTAAPPLASVGPQSVSDVTPSATGFTSAAEIAQYAALISRYGSDGTAHAAQVAHAVLSAASGTSGLPSCVNSASEAKIVSAAADLAGPYKLTFAAQPGNAIMGEQGSVSVTVQSRSGAPVPNAQVSFAAATDVLGGNTATTDSSGVASVGFLIPTGTTSKTVPVKATVKVSTGLKLVTAQAQPSPSNPSGASVTAVYPAAPTPTSATQQLAIEQTAHPVLSVSSSRRAVSLGKSFTPQATVTGMNGHTASVAFTVSGPVALTEGTLCTTRTAADFATAVTPTGGASGASNSVDTISATSDRVVGDGTAQGDTVTPTAIGCYWVSAALHTSDATPAASAKDSAGHAIVVLDTTAKVALDHTLIGKGDPVTGKVALSKLHGAAATAQTVVAGPVHLGYDKTSCAGVDFSSAPTKTIASSSTQEQDSPTATATAYTTPLSASTQSIGCYEVTGRVTVQTGDGASLSLSLTGADSTVLSIDPQVSLQMNITSVVQKGRITATVSPVATFSQAGHVRLEMLRTHASQFGCREANYSHAVLDSVGTPVAVQRNEFPEVKVSSASLPKIACYKPVAVLTMDDNTSITASTTFTYDDAVLVGYDINAPHRTVHQAAESVDTSMRGTVVALSAYGALALLAVIAVFVIAMRSGRGDRFAPELAGEGLRFNA